jgi:hypothetical protein
VANTASVAIRKVVELLRARQTGLEGAVAQLAEESGVALASAPPAGVVNQNVSFELSERSLAVKYPVVHVYADRIRNELREKFRRFSGTVRMVAEVRVSEDRLEGIEEKLRLYVDAVTRVLDENRGCWGEGAFFGGRYEVAIEPVRHGGKNFLQTAKVSFEVDLSQ